MEVYQECNPDKLSNVDELLKKYEGAHQELYERICVKYNIAPGSRVQRKYRRLDTSKLVPRERAKLMPLSSALSIFDVLKAADRPVLRSRTKVEDTARALPDPASASPADLVLDFIAQCDRVETALSAFEGLSPTSIMGLQEEEASRKAGENLLAGRATQRQVTEAMEGVNVPPPTPSTLMLISREIPSTLEGPPRTAATIPSSGTHCWSTGRS